MIKTFAYNEFNFSVNKYQLDKEKTIQEIQEFIENGGDLNLPVKHDDKFKSALKFLEEQFDVDFVSNLLNKNYLINPGKWTLNPETKTIKESAIYHSYWYRDNYDKYKVSITNGFQELCRDFVKNPIYDTYEYTDFSHFSHSNEKNHIIRKNHIHPLLTIILKMPHKDMVNVFLNEIPNAKELLSEIYFKEESFADFIVRDSNDTTDILNLFFKHNIFDLNTLINDYKFNDVIKNAIFKNDFDFINLLKSKSDNINFLGELDQNNKMYDSLLRSATSPEMAKILIDSGCQVLKKGEQYNSIVLSHEYFPLTKIDTIKFIIDYVPLNYMTEYKNIFHGYLEHTNNIDLFKEFTNFIVSKGFPINEYDLFNICPGDEISERIQTCLDLGANPNNCQDLIQKIISKRDTSLFKSIQKTKLLNLYSNDGLSYLLSAENHTQGTLSLLDKAPNETFNQLNSFGKPVWFSADSKDKLNKILKNIDSFNQVDKNGDNWITYYYSQKIKDKHQIVSLVLEMASIEENKNHSSLYLTNKENSSNLLHYGFDFDGYKNKELRDEFVTIIKTFNYTNLNLLFSELNEHGLFPIDYLIQSYHNENNWNKTFWDSKLNNLLKMADYNLDYDKINSKGKTLIDTLRLYFSLSNSKENFIEHIEQAYSRYKLYDKLDNSLVSQTRKQSTVKI